MESSLCWKHLSGCFISRIFSAPCFILQLPYAFSPPLSCVQAPTHSHFIPSPHPVCCWYALPLLCWVKLQSFSCLWSEFTTQNLHFLVISPVYDRFSPHPSLPFFSLLSPPCRPFSHEFVRGVCCSTAAQAGKWGEGKSGAGSLRVFSCQSHEPSQYPALKLGETKNMDMSLD